MTIRLLVAYAKYPINAIVMLDAGTEAGLVAAKLATTDTTGGVAYVAPTVPNQRYSAQVELDSTGAVVGLAQPNAGRFQVYGAAAPNNADGRADGTVYVQSGAGAGAAGIFVKVAGTYKSVSGSAVVPRRLICANVPASGPGSYIPASYQKTRAALAAVRAGTSNMLFGLIGDSTTMGVGALNVSTANCRYVAPIESLARAFNSADIPARSNSFDGDSNFYVTTLGASNGGAGSGYQGYDGRVILPSGWVDTTAQSAGGAFFQNTTNVAPLTFYYAGWDATDTAIVRYRTGPAATPFTISRGAQGSYPAWTTQTITPALTEGIGVVTVTGALSQGGIVITPTAVGTVEILGIEVYDSTTKCVRMHSLAWSGGDTAQMVATGNGAAWNPLPALLGMKFDLVSIQLGTNGWGNSIPVATWQANLDTLVSSLLSNGTEVILLTPYPSAFATAPYLTQLSYVNAIYAVALKYGLIVNDAFRKTGVQESGYQYGLYFDNKHPRNPLYQSTMEGLADVIMSVV